MPMGDRVEHKNWKCRAEAFDDMRKAVERVFSSEDPCIDEFGELMCVGLRNMPGFARISSGPAAERSVESPGLLAARNGS